ncbi:MAG: hypothetical protein ACR2MT_13395 [Aurantibacter sp.]
MTDELELLKKDWQNKEEHLPKLSYNEIHTMIWKKSSSIVKWILIISILEFVLPHLMYLVPGASEGAEMYEQLGITNFLLTISILSYAVTLYFIFQFYKRFKEISTLDSAKDLMSKIIKTRNTVKYYVIYSLSMAFVIFSVLIGSMYFSENLLDIFPPDSDDMVLSPESFRLTIVLMTAAFCTILLIAIGAIYFLLYGLLLRKLKKNYTELKKLEV